MSGLGLSWSAYEDGAMPSGLKRFQKAEALHFIKFSCFHRLPLLVEIGGHVTYSPLKCPRRCMAESQAPNRQMKSRRRTARIAVNMYHVPLFP